MRLVAVKITNYRAYLDEQTFRLGDLTALVGRNDVGKSSVLDALGLFFEHPFCKADGADRCVHAPEGEDTSVTCVFSDLPGSLVLDDSSVTTLEREYLLNHDGNLEIRKTFSSKSMKAQAFVIAEHPSSSPCNDLLLKKNTELKALAGKLNAQADKRSNTDLREAIRRAHGGLTLTRQEVPVAKEGGKQIITALQRHFPLFNLFRADRPSTDEEDEVQDPLKLAVKEAIGEVEKDLDQIKERVRERTLAVAERTLKKLNSIDENLAGTLKPIFKSEPKWDSLFKLSLEGDDGIAVNKRGSGVRRLVLLSFFQAEVERLRGESAERDVIYAIEEPETSQHPANQRRVIDALVRLSEEPGRQVVVTTHVPALAGMLPVQGVRHVTQNEASKRLIEKDADIATIASDLGVHPDLYQQVKVLFCVEGPTDVEMLCWLCDAVRKERPDLPNIRKDSAIALVPLGGDTLRDWVNKRYLRDLRLPEFHLYDGDGDRTGEIDKVKGREDGSDALTMSKREIENYLHEDALPELVRGKLTIDDDVDVEAEVRKALGGKKSLGGKKIKRLLAEEAGPKITADMLRRRGAFDEVVTWFERLQSSIKYSENAS